MWAVALPMPGARMPSSFGYAFFGDDGVHIVDPGWGADENLGHWQQFLAARGKRIDEIRTIVVTHSHPDHLGVADRLREHSGARIVMSGAEAQVLRAGAHVGADIAGQAARLTAWGVPTAERRELLELAANEQPSAEVGVDASLETGDVLELGAYRLSVQATPGHTSGHLCFVEEAAGVILTGDHVLPQIHPGLGLGALPGSVPLTDYLQSLHAMNAFDAFEALPGHEFRFRGLAARSERIAAHHLRRTRAVVGLALELGEASVWEYAVRSPWSRGWEGMRGFLRVSALMQTEQHLDAVRSGLVQPWLLGEWARDEPNHA